ncbi:MAG: AAA-like domain-containing protein [Cyanobacteria bacterium P01_G01_bin.54]
MDAIEALKLTDQWVFAKTGKHLNDLEREVFCGSWEGKTYEQIYPLNPQYVEKSVGYKLWQKLSGVFGEKVTKKTIRGAIERRSRSLSPSCRVLIGTGDEDATIAQTLELFLSTDGHEVSLLPLSLPELGLALPESDYLIVLLSAAASVSEMVLETMRQVRDYQLQHQQPILLPVGVDLPHRTLLNHDLRTYLTGVQIGAWQRDQDNETILHEVRHTLSQRDNWETEAALEAESETLPEDLEAVAKNGDATDSALPLPVAEPELPKGQVRLASAFYVVRQPYEDECYRAIAQPGALIRLKAPRQMGKTSLMARILYQAREQGYRTVPLSFQHADQAVFENLNALLQWFCLRIARKLRISPKLDDYWTQTYGSKDNCTAFFEDCLLSQSETPLVLGLDEVDRVFDYPTIADDFFGLLRAWYEEAGYGDMGSELWERLRLVVVHSTEAYLPMPVTQSPFNVGLPIDLTEFTVAQVQNLAARHGLDWSERQIAPLMEMVGGHPYLVRLALYAVAHHQISLAQLLDEAVTEAGVYGDHLRRHGWNLQQHPELGTAFQTVVTLDHPVELESIVAFKLHSMGLVRLHGNAVTPRFALYRHYFRDRFTSEYR